MKHETMACDLCGGKVWQDTGVWLGGELVFKQGSCRVAPLIIESHYDLCQKCSDKMEQYIEKAKEK